jgi:hypothetical protein
VSDTQIFMHWVDELDVEFDPIAHAVNANEDGFSLVDEEAEGEITRFDLEREKPVNVLAILGASQKQIILVSESATGDPHDAVLLYRARIDGLPGDVFAPTQTIKMICAPEDIEDRLLAFAKERLNTLPEFDPIFPDNDPEDFKSYLSGRTAAYYVDPATHEISLVDTIVGERVVNLADKHFHDDQEVPTFEIDQRPAKRALMQLDAQWTQAASGVCDVSYRIGAISTITGVGGGSGERDLPSVIDIELGGGWELERSWAKRFTKPSLDFFGGRTYRGHYQIRGPKKVIRPNGQVDVLDNQVLRDWTVDHDEFVTIQISTSQLTYCWLRFNYQQPRVQHAYVVVDIEAQVGPVVTKDLDLGQKALKDLLDDSTSEIYEAGVSYEVGDRRQKGDRVYVCNEDHFGSSIYQLKPGSQTSWYNQIPVTYSRTPYWDEVPSDAALKSSSKADYYSTERGQQSLAHAILQCRQALLEGNRSVKITVTYTWDDARAVTTRDSVRLEIPDGDGYGRPVVGKVIAVRRTAHAEEGLKVQITIACSLGTGADDRHETEKPDGFIAPGYVSSGYFKATQDLSLLAGDTVWEKQVEKARQPIDVGRLISSAYSVINVRRENEAGQQLAVYRDRCVFGRDQAAAARAVEPTRIRLQMRSLEAESLIESDVDVAAEILVSPRGIDLVGGGEP